MRRRWLEAFRLDLRLSDSAVNRRLEDANRALRRASDRPRMKALTLAEVQAAKTLKLKRELGLA